MARSRSRQGSTQGPSRETADFANSFELLTGPNTPRSGRLMAIEDRRAYTPARVPVSRTTKVAARIAMLAPSGRPADAPGKQVYAFKIPRQVAVCARREIRKQVIHALGVAGKKVRRPRRNAFSSISCRRK